MNNNKLFKNHWIDNETLSLKSKLKSKRNDYMVYKMLAMSLILLFLSLKAFGDDVYINDRCPLCHNEINSIETFGIFPDTWRCSNPKCKYENYDGINYCALCGTKRKG